MVVAPFLVELGLLVSFSGLLASCTNAKGTTNGLERRGGLT